MSQKKKALITGIAGQDGSYIAELLIEKGYEVHGLVKKLSQEKFWRIEYILNKITLHEGDVRFEETADRIVKNIQPDELYHLAAISVSRMDFEEEISVFENNLNSVFYLLRAIKKYSPASRFFLAASAIMYGNNAPMPQDENTPMRPATPYAIAKNAAFYLVKMYREFYGIFAVSGILFNHESPRRGNEFVTKKISSAAAQIKLGLEHELILGNLDAERDWGFAGDFAEAMWLMLQTDKPEDFVIGSGEKHTVRDFVKAAFDFVDLDYKQYVKSDLSIAVSGPTVLLSNPAKARRVLNWRSKVGFIELIKMMVNSDLEKAKKNI